MIGGSFFPDGELSLASYVDVLSETRSLILLLRSIAIAAAVAHAGTLIGVPVAFLLERTDVPFRRTVGVLCLVPLIIPAYISAIGWLGLFRGVSDARRMQRLRPRYLPAADAAPVGESEIS